MIFIIFTTIIIAAFIIHKFHYNTDTIVVVVVIALAIMGFSCNRQFDSLFKKEIQKKKRIIWLLIESLSVHQKAIENKKSFSLSI